MPGGNQLVAQLGVVLDDAVVDDRQAAMAIQMWMRIGLGDPAMGGPAGMPKRNRATGQRGRSLTYLADVLLDQQSVMSTRDAPRIVAAVLELLQPREHHLRRLV